MKIMISEQRANVLHGILLIALFSFSAFYIAEFEFVKRLSFSPLIVGIILGMLYANSLRNRLPATWVPGIQFCTKQILRAGIILYGFRLTFQSVVAIGLPALLIDGIIVTATIFLGLLVGRLLKMDRDLSLLTATGSAICGAAAVLGAEPVVKGEPHKTAVAVSTVVIFGTLSMFIYPALYRAGVFDLTAEQMGLYTGATLHEVAHVVGAGNAMGAEIADSAIIVKMIRVMLLAPVLLIMGLALARGVKAKPEAAGVGAAGHAASGATASVVGSPEKPKITIPWFAFGFLVVIGLNSLLPQGVSAIDTIVNGINRLDTFMLTMAMTALGAETSFDKFKKAGFKPFLLAFILYIWLMGGGYLLVKYLL